ncbi:hypothetical protein [Mesorhizobium sp. M0051]|uniref:hypothetical protein n=1 Tax=Mesorhizobium sp. M0051 TaxID=2956862 RepID=UPI003339F0F1
MVYYSALGLGWGPTGIEFRWTKRGSVVIAVIGGFMARPLPSLIHLAYGIDLVTEHIKVVIGDDGNFSRKHSKNAAARFLVTDRDGILIGSMATVGRLRRPSLSDRRVARGGRTDCCGTLGD